jgi:2-oxoglutarate ferredoxin oxidoreductase subunit beta
MHDGSRIILHKLGKDYDPTNKAQAIQAIHGSIAEGKFLTGLIYYNRNRKEFAEELNLCDMPLSELTQDDLQPPLEALERINADMMK